MKDSLAILLPVYNAQHALIEAVGRTLEIAVELTRQCEIAIIDDGSDDGTEEIACDLALQYPQVLVARHHTPRGIDEAIHTGVQMTAGSIIMIIPPECDIQVSEMRRLWRIGTGQDLDQLATPAADNHLPAESKVMSRLMKWGQALREESASRQGGIRMVRRASYRKPTRRGRSLSNRIDDRGNPSPTSAPNFITQLRDLAFGE